MECQMHYVPAGDVDVLFLVNRLHALEQSPHS
jgi:hypothetical protein